MTMSLKPCERRLLAMSVSTAWKVACDSTIVPGEMFGRIGLPGSSVTIGATSALPSARAIDSPVAFSTWLCLPVVRYGPFSSMPPVRTSAVVLPPLIRSRTSSIVRSSIQTLSCMSIGRGMLVTSTRGAVLTDAVRRSGSARRERAFGPWLWWRRPKTALQTNTSERASFLPGRPVTVPLSYAYPLQCDSPALACDQASYGASSP